MPKIEKDEKTEKIKFADRVWHWHSAQVQLQVAKFLNLKYSPIGIKLFFHAQEALFQNSITIYIISLAVHALNKLPYSKLDSKSVGVKEGVIFLTYSSLIASSEKGRSRMQQLQQWCGSGYDGLIIFDEVVYFRCKYFYYDFYFVL